MNVKLLLPVLLGILLIVAVNHSLVFSQGQLLPLTTVAENRDNFPAKFKVELGKRLFFDRRLSGDGTMSCASCHMPDYQFTDGEAISFNYPTTKNWRNAPTLINLIYSRYLFHDGRSESIEEQALFPIMSAFEMNQNLDYLEEEIRTVPQYLLDFKKAFGDNEITKERIGLALASFERTLISADSPLDKYLLGDKKSLSAEELKGFQIFTGKGNCTKCHYGVNLIDDKFHALGVPENSELQNNSRVVATLRFVAKLNNYKDFRNLNEDPGRYLITKQDKDWKAFKTPTLRDISLTAPYMHNGVFQTLEEVIDFFDKGGGASSGITPLGLTIEEKKFLLVFLQNGLKGRKIIFDYPELAPGKLD